MKLTGKLPKCLGFSDRASVNILTLMVSGILVICLFVMTVIKAAAAAAAAKASLSEKEAKLCFQKANTIIWI